MPINGGKADVYKTIITILMTAISLLLGYFAVESRANRAEITEIKIKRAGEQVRLEQIQKDVTTIANWVEAQKQKAQAQESKGN